MHESPPKFKISNRSISSSRHKIPLIFESYDCCDKIRTYERKRNKIYFESFIIPNCINLSLKYTLMSNNRNKIRCDNPGSRNTIWVFLLILLPSLALSQEICLCGNEIAKRRKNVLWQWMMSQLAGANRDMLTLPQRIFWTLLTKSDQGSTKHENASYQLSDNSMFLTWLSK